MAKETTMKEAKEEVVAQETEAKATKQPESNEVIFPVKRKTFEGRDGKEYWTYYVEGDIIRIKNGERVVKHVTVDFVAKDSGGYEVLDLIFLFSDEAQLSVHDEKMVNDKTKEVTVYTVYDVFAVDDNGERIVYKVKPSRESDKSLLMALISSLKYSKGDNDAAI